MVLRITRGYSPEYLLKEVATGRENYYTGAVAAGEPPGRWWGAGAEQLGLRGLVDAQDMRAVYERFLDPRAEGFKDPQRWDEVTTLGHTGRKYLSEDELYAAAVEREPYATPERRVELRTEAGKAARHNVAFFDVTFNVQKSVTLLHTAFEAQEVAARTAGDEETAVAWAQFRQAVEDAIWAGNNAGLTYLAEHAGYTRVGHHGGADGRYADAHDWVVASFFQHDSRNHDPHLHIHNGLLNRVQGPDGQWRTLDGRSLYRWRPAAAAVAERTTAERLTPAIGVLLATRPDGKAREVVGVAQEAMDLISSRRRTLTAKAEELVAAFETRYGRAPNGLQRERLMQQATLLTRCAKSHTGETREELLDRIDARIRADINGGLAGVAQMALAARGDGPTVQEWSPRAVIELALAQVQQRKSGWTRADLAAEINAALPDYLGLPDGADVARLLDTLTDEAIACVRSLDHARPGDALLPAELRLNNDDSAYVSPGSTLYATDDHIHTERVLVAATAGGGAAALPHPVAARFLDGLRSAGIELGVDQAAAVRGVLTSGARVESLVGPAGTGKSFVVGAIARGWTHPGGDPAPDGSPPGGVPRRVFGLATSQIATKVLTEEGLTARNVTRWLATQDRLAAGPGAGLPQPIEGDEAWRLHAGDLVVVDESAMTDTTALAQIHRYVDAAGAKLLLVGDHKQLAAVGAGGAMDLLAAAGNRYELTEARRFTHDWERAASLRLRAGDTDVLRTYHQHGRLLDAGTREQAEQSAARAWLGDILAGRRSLLLVDTNDQAARLSAQLRAELVRLGRVADDGIPLASQGTVAGVGDLVQARFNGWDLAGVDGNRRGPINRETYQVTSIRDDGGLDVAPVLGPRPDGAVPGLGERLVLPASYVAGHLALAYASTVHAVQGQTVDSSHAVITSGTSLAALYVGLSRGRGANTAHVATVSQVDDPAQGSERHQLHRDPVAVLAGLLNTDEPVGTRSALAIATESAEEAGSVRTAAELLADAAQLAATERTAVWLDQLTATGVLTADQRARLAAEDGAPALARTLRCAELAGHDPHQTLADAVTHGSLTGAKNLAHVLSARITDGGTRRFDPVGSTYAEWTPRIDNPDWNDYLTALAAAADHRAAELGRAAAADAPGWAVEALGPVPDDRTERDSWEERAGVVAAYRELRGHDDPAEALGAAPKAGQVEQYAAYRAAWRVLGRPEVDQATHQLSDGQLRMRVRGWQREQAWGPRYVGHELADTHQAAAHHRQTAALRRAEADTGTDCAERVRLHREAAEAAALADALDHRAAQLQQLDDARAAWLAHTAGTRAAAEDAEALLAERHANDAEPEPVVTAEEWLAAHRAAVTADEHTREITADDVTHNGDQDRAMVDPAVGADPTAAELREVAVAEPRQAEEDVVRVPSADEVSGSVTRARRSLAEIAARDEADQHAADHERSAQLGRWHDDDHTVNEQAAVDESVLEFDPSEPSR
ncbi:MobF family relaxase [Pseudonocardia charpentierae]|uniref:MobF family relaxase n=1 Tax=Pseudonocardia charpentierae TaxID=3075545 RepID=A0ABU2NI42_9PSEU|nr:MobF family relaxase [Pseudonocardia sp. DSM 45834]MDT0352904.1 MobF family relaxase [Pseudonocardia sp. DSM 45834]